MFPLVFRMLCFMIEVKLNTFINDSVLLKYSMMTTDEIYSKVLKPTIQQSDLSIFV